MKDHSHASDSELVRELTTTRGALRDAIRIGETIQAKLDAKAEKFFRLRRTASTQPLGVDISDYSDEWCAGFLAGQSNAFDQLEADA